MKSAAQILLASRSPRRAELLRQIGVLFEVCPADVDETLLPDEDPQSYVVRVARLKAQAVTHATLPVLAADTIVVQDGDVLGKPVDRSAGLAYLARLSAREHQVLTAVAVCRDERIEVSLGAAQVSFRKILVEEAERYWDTGEPRDKAWGYGIQGIGGIFVDRISGSYSAVVGLPLSETERLLRSFRVDTWRNRGA